MDVERYQRLKQLVIDALELEPEARAGFIEAACADDPALRERAIRMLERQVDDDFLAASALSLDEDLQTQSTIGKKIGRIRIQGLIARGGMGEVYRGLDELLQRPVAVKLMRNQWRLSGERRDHFLAEAQALSALDHPNICQVHDFFEDQDRDVLVLELIEGETLRAWLDREGRPKRRKALAIALQIAEALVSAHERGVAHRDLKPENVMLNAQGQVKVLDFGLARSVAQDHQASESASAPESSTKSNRATQLAGTPGYLAPEQARGEPSTTASDLWSFGALLIELLSGKAPFDSTQSGPQLLDQARAGQLALPGNQPRAETALLQSLLEPDPGQRPSARELRNRLRRIIKRPRRRLTLAAAGLTLLVLAGAGFRYTSDLQHERQQANLARAEAEDLARFMLEDLYTGLLSVGRLDLLEPVADKTLDYFAADPAQRSDRPETGLALMRSAQVLDYQGRLRESMTALEQALARLRAMSDARPEDLASRFHLASGLHLLSNQLSTAGEHARARETADEAVTLAEHLLEQAEAVADGRSDETAEYQALVLSARAELGNALSRAGRFDAAIEVVDRALEQAGGRLSSAAGLEALIADLHWTRCLAHLERRTGGGAIEACTPSLALDRAALAERPDDAMAKLNLSNSLWLMSRAQRQSGQAEAALASTADAERLSRELMAWDPDQPQHANQLVVILISRARALADLGRADQRRQALEESLQLTSAMVGDGEDQMIVHNHATTLALLGRREDARRWTAHLLDGGWSRPEFLELCRSLDLDPRCSEGGA